jgi:pyridoxamine--pyruvate transaminase
MGTTARPIYAVIAVTALVGTMTALGVKNLDLGAGVSAAMAVIDSAV